MNRTLARLNLLGILLLAVLCAAQWRANRAAHQELARQERAARAQAGELNEARKALAGTQEDLERFRGQLGQVTTEARDSGVRQRGLQQQLDQASAERDQLRGSVTNWAAAVEARDVRIIEANERLEKLALELDSTVGRFNALATEHNALVGRYNSLADQVRTNAPSAGQQDGRP